MAPLPWFILWPLRKAAIIPAVVITAVAVGASYGSFDLARKVVTMALPSAPVSKASGAAQAQARAEPKKKRKLTTAVAGSAALVVGAATAAARELAFPPVLRPPPDLPITEGMAMEQRLRNATAVFLHQVVHYPYKHRFTTSFMGGTTAGVAFALADWAYNRNKRTKGEKEDEEERGFGGWSSGGVRMARTAQEVKVAPQGEGATGMEVEGVGEYGGGGPAQTSPSNQSPPPSSASSSASASAGEALRPPAKQQQQQGHAWDDGGDALAALGLYPSRQHGEGQRPSSSSGGNRGSSGSGSAEAGAGAGAEAGAQQEEFFESYRDAYKAKGDGAGEEDRAARRMGGFEGAESSTGGGGGGSGGGGRGGGGGGDVDGALSSSWDPYAARVTRGGGGQGVAEDGDIQYETPPDR